MRRTMSHDRSEFEGWGTGIETGGGALLLADNPIDVLDKWRLAADEDILAFSSPAGFVDDNRLEPDAYLPERPIWVRAEDIYAVDPMPPAYMEWHSRGHD
jgi:hypothetical protein